MNSSRTAALRVYVEQLIGDVAGTLPSADDVQHQCETISSVVNAALASVKRQWNASSSKPHALPIEILADIFSVLDLRSCVRASCVSTQWRAAALGSSRLWDDIKVAVTTPTDVYMVKDLLQRARGIDIDLSLGVQDTPDVNPIIYEACDRIRSLKINNYPSLLLRNFQSPRGGNIVKLDIHDFVLAGVSQPFWNLVSFKAGCSESGENLSNLFSMCPNLVELELRVRGKPINLPTGPIPKSLTRLTLRTAYNMLDYPCFWAGHALCYLGLSGSQNLTCAFSHVDFAIIDLELCFDNVRVVGASGHIVELFMSRNASDEALIYHKDFLRPRVQQLRRLLVFDNLQLLMTADLDMPVLEELILEHPMSRYLLSGMLRVPALRTLTIRASATDNVEDFLQVLPQFFEHTTQKPVRIRVLRELAGHAKAWDKASVVYDVDSFATLDLVITNSL